MGFQWIRHSDNRTYLRNKLGGGVAQGLQHWRGLGVEQGHPIGHLVVDFVLCLQLCDGARETFFNLTQSEDNNNCTSLWNAFHRHSWMIQCRKWNHVAWHEPCEQTQAASAWTSSLRPHLLVVQPVPAYGPPVVAEVVLDGWICHLWTGKEEPCFSQVVFSFWVLKPLCRPQQKEKPLSTFSSSKLSVKWRISANCLARACSLSRCCMGAYGGLVSASNRLRRAFSAKHIAGILVYWNLKDLIADDGWMMQAPSSSYSDSCKSL